MKNEETTCPDHGLVSHGEYPCVEEKYVAVGDIEIELLADYVLIKADDPITKTKGGILLVGGAEEVPDKGLVVASGQGRHSIEGVLIPCLVNAGDYVLFKRSYILFTVKIQGEEYLVVAETDVIGRIKKVE